MKTNSKFISLSIALVVAPVVMLTTRLLWGLAGENWWLLGILTLLLTFAGALAVLELLLFREIRKMSEVLKKLGAEPSFKEGGMLSGYRFQNFKEAVLSYTQIKQLEIDQLKSMAQYRREFLADISHELKTPIFAAQGYVHTLLDGAIDDSHVKMRFLKKAARSLDGLDALVQDLLILSRLETGQITMDSQPFNIYELTHEVFEELESKALKKRIKLGFGSGTYKNIMVRADQNRISQVLRNLVMNGINYTEEKGHVIVDFETGKDRIVIHVKDNGKGIPGEHLDRIFERFYRVEKSRAKSSDRGGTGLGLAIVKHILEQHKSKIKVKSVIDKGSDFYFELPKGENI